MAETELPQSRRTRRARSECVAAVWTSLFPCPAPARMPRGFLMKLVAQGLQEREIGGLPKDLERALAEAFRDGGVKSSGKTKGDLSLGTRLVRSWGNAQHEVTVIEDGFAYRGKAYGSLSEIARAHHRCALVRSSVLRHEVSIGGARMNRALRCAIYTRKSSEEGLDQAFNSLDAQREACAAYIESQRHEGWTLLPMRYDDGGFSGGNLERPALQQLLADIAEGKLDLIVVYKVDRLTRSLSDFAKLVEQLDAKNVSFVSVTQAFNTTTSMGRLTLNVLLSFAQFEREVTGERIRDKIAASKKKGMWMGGMVPLGYDVVDRKLVVNEADAEQVRTIYRRYLELGGVAKLADTLKAEGFRTRVRTAKGGTTYGGCSPSNGALFKILTNPIYRGDVRHRETRYPGQHEAIVPQDLWNAAQVLREKTRRAASTLPKAQKNNPLLGLLTDEQGRKYKAVHTTKARRRYRYYVAKTADRRYQRQPLSRGRVGTACGELHRDFPGEYADGPRCGGRIHRRCAQHEQAIASLEAVKKECAYTQAFMTWRGILHGVRIESRAIQIRIDRRRLRVRLGFPESAAGQETTIDLQQPLRLHRTAHELRLVVPSDGPPEEAAKRDQSLVRFIARGRHWYRQITSGEMPSIQAIAAAEGVTERYVARVLRGSLLAPTLMHKIVDGRQPIALDGRFLLDPPPLGWNEQQRKFASSDVP